ncbi:uncharacterized protein [Rutidosis leptorrhynchoides]|uniref:uncharacterized protein n=1 Tax=Rutidosis leptorrhynchoides TaxID=125765 RepID=UPI003A9A2E81
MRQRNMVYTGPMIDTEIEHAHIQPEPCLIPYGHIPSGFTIMAAPPGPRVVPLGTINQLPFPNHPVIDGPHVEFKQKITEGFHINLQYSYPAPGSSPFVIPDYRGFEVVPLVMGPVHHRGSRNRIASPTDIAPGVQFVPMNHLGQPLPVVPGPWLDNQFCGSAPAIPYMQGYANGNPITFVHQPPPQMAPLRPQPPAPRFMRPAQPMGVGVYQPHGQELMIESTSRQHSHPHLRVLPEDGVAMLGFGNYGHRVDNHRDMRLDIDHMSYEELLALGEQIGNAGSGLADDFIVCHLKTRTFSSCQPEGVLYADQGLNICTICQMDYSDQEKIGMLDCSHEYHVDCIHKWLVEKNNCPVCKCTGLATHIK